MIASSERSNSVVPAADVDGGGGAAPLATAVVLGAMRGVVVDGATFAVVDVAGAVSSRLLSVSRLTTAATITATSANTSATATPATSCERLGPPPPVGPAGEGVPGGGTKGGPLRGGAPTRGPTAWVGQVGGAAGGPHAGG